MVEDPELRELYGLIYTMLDGFNKTHDVQVQYVDFNADVPADGDDPDCVYAGSVVLPSYEVNVIDFEYRELGPDDFDWFGPEDWPQSVADVERIKAANRKEAQKRHREGTLRYAPWLHNPDPWPDWKTNFCS